MTEQPTEQDVEEPIETGWYAYAGGAQTMIFHLRSPGQWSAHFSNGTASDCAWGYIEQALGVWDLVPIGPERAAEAWDEGYSAARTMAHCWGHTDHWEDEPDNPYRALRGDA